MTYRDSISYLKTVRITKRHLNWVGLSESARDILAFLVTERYWSNESLSHEELSMMTGYSRGSISGGITQLNSLGFIESRIDAKQESKGRRTTRYAVNDGLTGLIAFGIRRLSIELEGMLNELGTVKMGVERKDNQSLTALALLEEEAKHNLEKLRKNSRELLLTKDRTKEATH
ncbi:MAG: hypothetical protein ACW98Y_21045 [Candidatus Thorarchaeota archaeon]